MSRGLTGSADLPSRTLYEVHTVARKSDTDEKISSYICYSFGRGLFVVASALRLNQGQNSQSFSDILYQIFTIQTVSENLSAMQ